MSLKKKAIHGFSWSMLEGVFSQGIIFIVGIILARLLDPKDIGLIGIISAFLSICAYLVEGGLKKALIRKINTTSEDYDTVFMSNIAMGVLLYLVIFFSAESIAEFYNEPSLKLLFQCIGVALILNSLAIIQNTLLIKNLDFKTQGIISIVATIISGVIAITAAYLDYGIWSLVLLTLIKPLVTTILYWYNSTWKPQWVFSKKSFNELFNFGYKLLAADLLTALYSNAYYFLIGKYFSTQALGYYTRAQQFQTPFSSNISLGIYRISFPILSSVQDDKERLKTIFIKFLRFAAFLNFTTLLALAAMAKPIVLLLVGEKWETSIYYLQLLCIPGMIYPLQILNLSLLIVKGYSNLSLKLEIIKKAILFPLIFISVLFSIEVMLYGLILFAFIELVINSFYTKKLIGVSIVSQIKELLPFFAMAIITFIFIYAVTLVPNISMLVLLILQLTTGLICFIAMNEVLKLEEYLEVKTKSKYFFKQFLKILSDKLR